MSKKILLADDSITIQKVIGITFANEDYELTVVDNGADAVAKASEIVPDLVLADVIMPEKDGYEVCKEIKAAPGLAGIPVILLTGTFEPFDEAKSQEVGADDYITKPFESQTLIDKVKEQLARVSAAPAEAPAVTPVAAPSAPEAEAPVAAAPVPPAPAPAAEDDIVFDLGADEVVDAPATETPVVETPVEETFTDTESPEEDMWAEDDFGDVSSASFDEPEMPDAMDETIEVDETPSDEDIWGDMDLGGETEVESDLELETFDEDSGSTSVDEFDEFEFEDEIPGVEDFMKEPDEPLAEAPLEEEGIEFEDELIETPPAMEPPLDTAVAVEPPLPVSPAEPAPSPAAEPEPAPVASPAPAREPVSAIQTDASQGLSEEQLRTLLSQASKEMIEKVIWEVVPELAETLIKEEIKKLKAAAD